MKLWSLERRFPTLAPHLKKWFVEYLVPANRSMGIRIVRVAPDSSEVVLRLPWRRRNSNVGGTVHGGVIMALAETAHGVAVLWQFSPDDHTMFAKWTRVEYLSKARGGLQVCFAIDRETIDRIGAGLDADGRYEITLSSEVTDSEDTVVARLQAAYQIRRTHAGPQA